MSDSDEGFPLCTSSELLEGHHLKRDILFEGNPQTILVIRFKGLPYAYLNRCVHMPRALDCLSDVIFDETGQRLRCSMHGIVFEPATGTSLSVICEGDRLTAIEIAESAGRIVATDYRVAAPAVA